MAAEQPVHAGVLSLFSITDSCVVCAAVAACASVLKLLLKKFEPGTKPGPWVHYVPPKKLKTLKKYDNE